MDDIASTKAQANDHLQRLREERGITGDDNGISDSVLVSSLDEALKLLSDQLYTTPTHFLLELIQNADDNTYNHEDIPRLHLSLYKKKGKIFFRSDCNEIGFTFQQLDALARIGKSTKKTITGGRKGYIGEKGIGFKSVFKVADKVRIASGYYEFKLDRRQTIGMMLPIPACFPSDDRVEGHTQVLLKIKSEDSHGQIKRELDGIEPQILLFIRKLQQLDVSVDGRDREYRLQKQGSDDDFGGETNTIVSTRGGITRETKYVIHRHTVKDLAPDSRRSGVDASEIVLAFAVNDNATPITKPQHVFAFLPVHCYGFSFLIHADFLLIASRESLEYQCAWNISLQRGIRDAVVTAVVDRFVHLGGVDDGAGLRYSWPKYLARQRESLSYWNDLHHNILRALRNKAILWSRNRDANLQTPTALRYVPAAYRFEGKTLFDLLSINATHLSFAYDDVYTHLQSIGVSKLDLYQLCQEFCQWVDAVGIAGIKAQSEAWHIRVSRLFRRESGEVLRMLRQLPIIPLRDGSWVNARTSHLYLPSQTHNEAVPSGVKISIVDHDAARNEFRRAFYKALGIEEYNPRQVCMLILELHHGTYWTGRSNQELIADAVYLFRHRYELSDPYKAPDIFFSVNEGDKHSKGHSTRIYLVDPDLRHGVIAKYKSAQLSPFTVLSDAYEVAIRKECGTASVGKFRDWLLESRSIFARTPDLIRNSSLTPEWTFLRDENVLDLLYAVRETLSTTTSPPPQFKDAVPRLKVRCLDGVSRILDGLAVPTADLRRACPHVDFADLPEPTYENWKFLSKFGVIVKVDTAVLLRELGALHRLPVQDATAIAVNNVYEALVSEMPLNPSGDFMINFVTGKPIRDAFQNKTLVFNPKPSPGRWLSSEDCVWSAPRLLTRVTALKSYYPKCKRLFYSVLFVREAETRHVVDEFCESTSGQERKMQERFEGLLFLLDEFHKKVELTDSQIRRIRSAKVLPVLTRKLRPGEGPEQVRTEMRAMDELDWYIPDSVPFEAAFRGKVDMLSLPVKSAKLLKKVLEVLGCEQKFLSESVCQEVKPGGMTVRNIREEEDLLERLRCIALLVDESNQTPPDLSSLRISSVPSITLSMSIEDAVVMVDDKLVTIDDSEGAIHIYLREGMEQAHRPLVTFEYVEYFKNLMELDGKFTSLITLLMSAPIQSLTRILAEHDIIVPRASDNHHDASSSDDTDSSDHGQTLIGGDDTPSGGDYDSRSGNDVIGLEGYRQRGATSAPTGSTTESTTDGTTDSDTDQGLRSSNSPIQRNRHPTPLRELIPSHQSRIESIIQRASAFRISDANATVPIQHDSEPRVTTQSSLPMRTTTTGNSHTEVMDERQAETQVVPMTNPPSVRVENHNMSSSHRRRQIHTTGLQRPDDTNEIRTREIGFLGELFIYETFAHQVNDWTFENWTSRLRSEAGHPPFRSPERDYSDLTYLDTTGQMRAVLRDAGVEPNPAWSNTTTFHLEVKGTMGPCAEPMFVSQNQVDKMRLFDKTPGDAYILLRVFNLEEGRETGVRFFRDPWSLFMNDVLKFRSDDGYRVFH